MLQKLRFVLFPHLYPNRHSRIQIIPLIASKIILAFQVLYLSLAYIMQNVDSGI